MYREFFYDILTIVLNKNHEKYKNTFYNQEIVSSMIIYVVKSTNQYYIEDIGKCYYW